MELESPEKKANGENKHESKLTRERTAGSPGREVSLRTDVSANTKAYLL